MKPPLSGNAVGATPEAVALAGRPDLRRQVGSRDPQPPEGDNASGPAQPVPRRSPYSTLRADDSAHEGA